MTPITQLRSGTENCKIHEPQEKGRSYMNRTISFKTAVAAASVSVFTALTPVFAQDEAEAEKPADEVAAPAASKPEKAFYPLMRCVRAEGKVQVLKPRTADWVDAAEGRYYPFGSVVRALGEGAEAPRAEFALGEKAAVVLDRAAEFATREIEIGAPARALELKGGRVTLKLPRSLGEGLFKVVAPAFSCENIAGESVFDYANTHDGDEAVVRCVTGFISLKGSHYVISRMGAANQIRIRTTGDRLFTSIRGESGNCMVTLDQGLGTQKNFETGEVKDVPKTLGFPLSPQCAIKIFRAKSTVGGGMSVSMMTFGASGDMLNRFAFAEGRSNVNSGELVISTKVPESAKGAKADDDEDDETETVEAAPAKADKDEADAGTSDDEEKDDKKADEKKDKDDEDI